MVTVSVRARASVRVRVRSGLGLALGLGSSLRLGIRLRVRAGIRVVLVHGGPWFVVPGSFFCIISSFISSQETKLQNTRHDKLTRTMSMII